MRKSLNQSPTSYEKGLALELKLVELFKRMGYDVIHDARKVGRSGVEHQIDVLAQYRCPLHTSQVIVEAKSYDSPIDKDRIMKLIQIVDDLGADRGVLVTTSYFTPEAIKTAKGYNVDLWDREQIVKFLGEIEITSAEKGLSTGISVKERVAHFVVTTEAAQRIVSNLLEKRGKGGLLGVGRIIESLQSITLQYFPYYEAEIQTTVDEIEKTGFLSTRTIHKIVTTKVSFDAINGDLIVIDELGASPVHSCLKALNEDEIKLIKAMKPKGEYTVQNIAGGLGISEGKAKKTLSGLVSKGALESRRGDRGVLFYRHKTPFPWDPRLLRSFSDNLKLKEIERADTKFVSPKIEAGDIIKRIELYWNAKVNEINLLYYPYYICNLITSDGSQRMNIVDAITGKLREL